MSRKWKTKKEMFQFSSKSFHSLTFHHFTRQRVGEWVVRCWSQRTRSYFWGLLPLCHFWRKLIKKCDRESARTHAVTEINWIFVMSHATYYSYAADKSNRNCHVLHQRDTVNGTGPCLTVFIWNKNSSGDEIANVHAQCAPEATPIRWNNAK